MRAIVQDRYGEIDALEVREIDVPVVGDDEVLIRVHAASVHPDVWHLVRGRPYVLRLMGAGLRRTAMPGTWNRCRRPRLVGRTQRHAVRAR
jgi:NADPH:quinone reductase-like Zn-dependent oxidoreductase